MKKRCSKCGEPKELDEFGKHKDKDRENSHYNSQCKLCKRKTGRNWYHLNRKKARGWAKRWRKTNPIKQQTACNRWRIANRKHDLTRSRKYSKTNVINLTDRYIKRAIVQDSGRKSSEVTEVEITIKRQQIMLHRELHQLKRAVNESN